MRTALAALLALATFLGSAEIFAQAAVPAPRERSGWRDSASWQQLRVGMSQADVVRILGEPGRITRYYAFTRWEYPDALGRRVNFDERGQLLAWGERAR